MKTDPGIIEHLNKILFNELIAINQYFLHARMLADWGLHAFADREYRESIEEMEHADELIKRILFLEGLPNLQNLGRLRIAESATELLECDLALELDAIPDLRTAIKYCEEQQDYVSRDLLRRILDNEEEHVDWLETQIALVGKIGEQNWLQTQIGAPSEDD